MITENSSLTTIVLLYLALTELSLWLISNLDWNISCFNTPKIPVRVNTSSCLASPIKTRSKRGANFTPLTLSTAKTLQESQLNLLKFNHSKTRATSQNNYSWICCLQCNQWWHSSCVEILSKDLVKYSKYQIYYSCLFCVVKEVSRNENANSKLKHHYPYQ